MKFKQFIEEEALNPKHTKIYTKLGSEVNYKEKYKELFGTEDRIYIPVSGKVVSKIDDKLEFKLYDIGISLSLPGERIKKVDIKKGILIFSSKFKDGKNVPEYITRSLNVEDAIKEFFKKNRYRGYASERDLLLGMYTSSPARKKGTFSKLNIVISRNPCDIAGMSTNKSWRSCMNLYSGSYNSYVRADIKEGTLIAYLIDVNDKDIDYPLGRVLIKPFENEKDKKIKYLKMSERAYGIFPEFAKKVVNDWLKTNQKKINGIFLFPKTLYRDTNEPEEITVGNVPKDKNKFKVGDRVKCIAPPDNNSSFVNKKGIVIDTKYNGEGMFRLLPIHVRFEDGRTWWCEPRTLEKIK